MTETPAPYSARRLPTALLCERASQIKMVCFDVDGTLTDGRIGYAGVERVLFFHTHDGHGLHRLYEAGIRVAWITANKSTSVRLRAEALRVKHICQGVTDKAAVMVDLMKAHDLLSAEVAYLGDDRIDVPAMLLAGLAGAPADAMPEARAAAHYVTEKNGGRGAAREFADLILAAQGKWAS